MQLKEIDPIQAQLEMAPLPRGLNLAISTDPARKAAVLVLIIPYQNTLSLVLTRRTTHLRGHSGQISFPGGKYDECDKDYVETAMRETCEELGLCDEKVEILGQLEKCYIPPSNFDVFPTVGLMTMEAHFIPNPQEVDAIIYFPLADLLNPALKKVEIRNMQGYDVTIPFYDVAGEIVWGATAVMLSDLEHRIRRVI